MTELNYECEGLSVSPNYINVEFAKQQEYPIFIAKSNSLEGIELKKEEVTWLIEHLNKLYQDMFGE